MVAPPGSIWKTGALEASEAERSHSRAEASRAMPSLAEQDVVVLFEQLRRPVIRYLLSLGISAPDAEEIAQEVFLALFQHLRQGKPDTNLRGWVFRVAHNLGLRQRARSRRLAEYFTDLPASWRGADELTPGPEERVHAIQRRQRLMAVVCALREQDRSCLWLRAEGLRYREIAEVLGMSLGSVAGSLERSLTRLERAGNY